MHTPTPRELAEAVGKGIFAGLAGTAAITASQMIEMSITGREQSDAPVQMVEKVFDVEPKDEAAAQKVGQLTHWGYGTSLGVLRGVLSACGLRGAAGTGVHFLAVWGAAATMLPAAGLAPPPTQWPKEQIAIDGLHHAVYAVAAGLVYDALDR